MAQLEPDPRAVLGALMIIAGIAHFVNPAMYSSMIPDGLQKDLINYGTGALEVLLGSGVYVGRFAAGRPWGSCC